MLLPPPGVSAVTYFRFGLNRRIGAPNGLALR